MARVTLENAYHRMRKNDETLYMLPYLLVLQCRVSMRKMLNKPTVSIQGYR